MKAEFEVPDELVKLVRTARDDLEQAINELDQGDLEAAHDLADGVAGILNGAPYSYPFDLMTFVVKAIGQAPEAKSL